METMSSQADTTAETAHQPERLEMKTSPEQTVDDTRKDCKQTLEKPRVTYDGLLNNLELCMQKSSEGNLDVSGLEQLTADLATFLTYGPSEEQNGFDVKLDDFYAQLKRVVNESVSDKRVSGSNERKMGLKQLADGLQYKVFYFKNVRSQQNSHESGGLRHSGVCVGG